MRRDPEYFEGRELDLIFIAKRLKDALRVENLLTEAAVDYAVETDTYQGGGVFLSERTGAFCYVQPEPLERASEILTKDGYQVVQSD